MRGAPLQVREALRAGTRLSDEAKLPARFDRTGPGALNRAASRLRLVPSVSMPLAKARFLPNRGCLHGEVILHDAAATASNGRA